MGNAETDGERAKGSRSCCGCLVVVAVLVVGVIVSLWYPRSVKAPSPDGRFMAQVFFHALGATRWEITDTRTGQRYCITRYRPPMFDDYWQGGHRLLWDPRGRGFVHVYEQGDSDVTMGDGVWAFEILNKPPFARQVLVDDATWALPLLAHEGVIKRLAEASSPDGRFTARVAYRDAGVVRWELTEENHGGICIIGAYRLPTRAEEWEEAHRVVWDPDNRGFLHVRERWSLGSGYEGLHANAFEVLQKPPFAQQVPVDEAAWAAPLLGSLGIK